MSMGCSHFQRLTSGRRRVRVPLATVLTGVALWLLSSFLGFHYAVLKSSSTHVARFRASAAVHSIAVVPSCLDNDQGVMTATAGLAGSCEELVAKAGDTVCRSLDNSTVALVEAFCRATCRLCQGSYLLFATNGSTEQRLDACLDNDSVVQETTDGAASTCEEMVGKASFEMVCRSKDPDTVTFAETYCRATCRLCPATLLSASEWDDAYHAQQLQQLATTAKKALEQLRTAVVEYQGEDTSKCKLKGFRVLV